MLSPKFTRQKTVSVSPSRPGESASELNFITELGRSLLFTVHPKKVASRVAGAVAAETGADICAFVVELEELGFVGSAFDSEGAEAIDFLRKERFRKWLDFLPPQVSVATADPDEFLLVGEEHAVEYISPVHINGQVKGILIAKFKRRQDAGERERRIIDAATVTASMSVNLSAHYEATMNASITQTREQQRKFTEAILDALPVSLYVIDREYKIVAWNRHREVGAQGVPRDQAIDKNIFDVLTRQPRGKLRQEFERAFVTGRIERIEQRTTDEKGATKHWLVSKIPMRDKASGEVTHVITVGEDVTVRVEAIHAVGRAEKLAAIGRLAAGVVHEINNPLATISACAEALENRVNEGAFNCSVDVEDLGEYLGLIRSEAFRCKTITTGLLDFSRVRSGNRIPIDVGLTLRSSARLVAHQKRGENIELKVEADDQLPAISADEGQLQQAIIALATNAIDAMPDGGTLTFRAFSQRGRVVVEVQDTGIGIHADDLSKIFEPFFTTKEIGKGTGLGLAVCYGIVTEHDGRLSVRSNPGKGTTFTMFFPTR
jgi:two-component system, NtrC family, sensor kinase